MSEVTKLIPDLRGLVDQRAEQLLNEAFLRVYEFFERKIAVLETENSKLIQQQASNFQKTSDLVAGIFATPLIGGNAANPLTSIGVGNGSVISVNVVGVSGFTFSGGPITSSGNISLSINAANARTTLGIDNIATKKSNLSAAVAPTVNDDSSGGYAIGSIWIDTTADDIYQTTDVTVGAAIWRKLN